MNNRIKELESLISLFKEIINHLNNYMDSENGDLLSNEQIDYLENVVYDIQINYVDRIRNEINNITASDKINNNWVLNVLSGLNFKEYKKNLLISEDSVYVSVKQYECITRDLKRVSNSGRNNKYSFYTFTGYDDNYYYNCFALCGKNGYNQINRIKLVDIKKANMIIDSIKSDKLVRLTYTI